MHALVHDRRASLSPAAGGASENLPSSSANSGDLAVRGGMRVRSDRSGVYTEICDATGMWSDGTSILRRPIVDVDLVMSARIALRSQQ
eukprot:1479153-Pyramimonas_sp.AAC.1